MNYQAQRASEIMQNGDHESAISILERVLKSNPYNFSVLTSKGHAEKTLGKADQAIESIKMHTK